MAPFDAVDVGRVAEFFDGSLLAVYAFARGTWLPETVVTLQRLRTAVPANAGQIAFLCDHLREGARVVGARSYVTLADEIAAHYSGGRWNAILDAVDDGLRDAQAIARWLDDAAKA